MNEQHQPWWRGTRGEWYVIIQLALMALVFFGPRTLPGLPAWSPRVVQVCRVVGIVLMVAGFALFLGGLSRQGRGLTIMPKPKQDGLIETGAYGIVRHPMYGGGVGLVVGFALIVHGWLTLALAAVLVVFLDLKATREERWLVEKFPGYPAYQRRVRKLVPFVR